MPLLRPSHGTRWLSSRSSFGTALGGNSGTLAQAGVPFARRSRPAPRCIAVGRTRASVATRVDPSASTSRPSEGGTVPGGGGAGLGPGGLGRGRRPFSRAGARKHQVLRILSAPLSGRWHLARRRFGCSVASTRAIRQAMPGFRPSPLCLPLRWRCSAVGKQQRGELMPYFRTSWRSTRVSVVAFAAPNIVCPFSGREREET